MKTVGITLLVLAFTSNPAPARAAAPPEPSPKTSTTPSTLPPSEAPADEPSPDAGETTPDGDVDDDAQHEHAGMGEQDDDASVEPDASAERDASVEPPTSVADASTPPADAEGDVPERLPVMQRAGWWTLFGALALGTAAGVLSGLAEREEDKAVRLALRFDPTMPPYYADVQNQYESILRRGEAFEAAAIALGAVAGAAAIAGVTVFIIDARRTRRSRTAAHLDWAPGGLGVRF